MKLVNAESRATGSGIFVAGAFPPVKTGVPRIVAALLPGKVHPGHRAPLMNSSPRENREKPSLRGYVDLEMLLHFHLLPFSDFYLAFKGSSLQ